MCHLAALGPGRQTPLVLLMPRYDGAVLDSSTEPENRGRTSWRYNMHGIRTFIVTTLFAFGFIEPAFASAPCLEYSNEWEACSADEDCVIELSACYFVSAYNKKYLHSVQEHNHCIRPMIKCAPPPPDDKQKTKAVCREKKCLAVKPTE